MALFVIGALSGRERPGDAVSSKGKRASARNTMICAERSKAATFRNIQPTTTSSGILTSCATFRNNQAIRESHNTIVIMQTIQMQCHKQQKCDTTNNGSVIMANRSAHNAIVISRFYVQAFATKRNISSAHLSYRLSLYSTFVLCGSSGLALVHVCYSTPAPLHLYAHIRISPYCYMIICR